MIFRKTPLCLFLSLLLQHRGVGEDFAFAAADQVRRLEIDYRKAKWIGSEWIGSGLAD